jgi:hypothetical protein
MMGWGSLFNGSLVLFHDHFALDIFCDRIYVHGELQPIEEEDFLFYQPNTAFGDWA